MTLSGAAKRAWRLRLDVMTSKEQRGAIKLADRQRSLFKESMIKARPGGAVNVVLESGRESGATVSVVVAKRRSGAGRVSASRHESRQDVSGMRHCTSPAA